MKNLFLLDGKQLPFQDSGEPKVFYNGNWHEIVADQDGEFYFMYHAKARYLEISRSIDPSEENIIDSFERCVKMLSHYISESDNPGMEDYNALDYFEKLIAKSKEDQPTYIVASSHGPTLDDSVDNFTTFRGGDGYAYSEALKEYKGLLKLEDTTLAVLARVIESTDY